MGGFLIMYEYAYRMAMRGHQVNVIHHPYRSVDSPWGSQLSANLKFIYGYFKQDFWLPAEFYERYPGVNFKWVPWIADYTVPDSDISIVSFWHTAEWVKGLNKSKGDIVYLVQEYEMFMTADPSIRDRMSKNFLAGFKYIAISPAVVELIESCGGKANVYIPNGIDLESFRLEEPFESESRDYIGFPYRLESFKASHIALEALEIVRRKSGENLKVWSFGPEPAEPIPDWIEYYKRPSGELLKKFYNKSKIFITPSDFEGWGLPGSEAMACGAALVSTDSGGVRGYAVNNKNALISPAGNVQLLSDNILTLLKNDELRIRLSKKGCEDINKFTYESATDKFESFLLGEVN